MSRSLYFAYGSNMCSRRLADRVGGIEIVGVATLRDFQHRFNKLGNDGTAKGNIEPSETSRVLGVAYHLGRAQLEILTAIESGYERIDIDLDLGGARLTAITYRAVVLSETVTPRLDYLEHYASGVREHDISLDYLREIAPPWYFTKK